MLPIVPQCTCPWRPLESHLYVDILLIHVVQIVQYHITLSFIKPDNAIGHGSIDPEHFPAGCRMNPDKWMSPLDILGPCCGIILIKVRMSRAVHSLLAIDKLAEAGGELLVSGIPTGPKRVTTNRWYSVVVKMGNTSRLSLMDQICMPTRCTTRPTEVCRYLGGLQSGPDDRDARNAWYLRDLRLSTDLAHISAFDEIEKRLIYMDLNLSVPFTKFLLLLWGDVLVSEKYHASLSNQKT